jgi:hypothetical protein
MQGIPALVSSPLTHVPSLKYDMLTAALTQMETCGQSRLAAADDHCVVMFCHQMCTWL